MEDTPSPDFAPDADPRRILVRSPRKQDILEYSLVLASQGLRHWMEFDGDEWSLTVDRDHGAIALEILELYQAENRGFQDPPPARGELDLRFEPLLFLAVPAVCWVLVGISPWPDWLHSHGSADAREILAGQWWRCITALTLHADDEHLLSNLVSGYFIVNLLNHRLRIGTIALLTTLGAAVANRLVALADGPTHVSIGFSTAVFCALGLLAAVETLSLIKPDGKSGGRPGERSRRSGRQGPEAKGLVEPEEANGGRRGWGVSALRPLSPLISALFVAILVGLGENVDVKAHFFGFAIGVVLGALARAVPERLQTAPVQAVLLTLTYALYALAWWLALRT